MGGVGYLGRRVRRQLALRALVAGWLRSRIWRSRLAMALALEVALVVMVVFLLCSSGGATSARKSWWGPRGAGPPTGCSDDTPRGVGGQRLR